MLDDLLAKSRPPLQACGRLTRGVQGQFTSWAYYRVQEPQWLHILWSHPAFRKWRSRGGERIVQDWHCNYARLASFCGLTKFLQQISCNFRDRSPWTSPRPGFADVGTNIFYNLVYKLIHSFVNSAGSICTFVKAICPDFFRVFISCIALMHSVISG